MMTDQDKREIIELIKAERRERLSSTKQAMYRIVRVGFGLFPYIVIAAMLLCWFFCGGGNKVTPEYEPKPSPVPIVNPTPYDLTPDNLKSDVMRIDSALARLQVLEDKIGTLEKPAAVVCKTEVERKPEVVQYSRRIFR